MLKLLILLLILGAGLIFGPQLAGNKGYVMVAFDQYTIEMSVTSALMFVTVIFIGLMIAIWLIRTVWHHTANSRFWWRSRSEKKAQHHTQQGLMALMRGDYQGAEKLVVKGASHSQTPMLNYLAAAEAAQEQGDDSKRDRYLECARVDAGSNSSAILLTQARLQLKQQEFESALGTIQQLDAQEQTKNNVQQMRHIIYHELGHWGSLIDLLPTLLKQRLISEQQFQRQQLEAYQGHFNRLSTEEGNESLMTYWNQMPRKVKKQSRVIVAISKTLMAADEHQGAYQILADVISKSNDANLFETLGSLRLNDTKPLISKLEKLRKSLGDYPPLLNALGEIYFQGQYFDKAISVLETSTAKQSNPEAFALLAQICEAQEQPQKALNYYRQALA